MNLALKRVIVSRHMMNIFILYVRQKQPSSEITWPQIANA